MVAVLGCTYLLRRRSACHEADKYIHDKECFTIIIIEFFTEGVVTTDFGILKMGLTSSTY